MQPPSLPVPLGATAARLAVDTLLVQRLPEGGVRISSPLAAGWSATARNPQQLARALHDGWAETDIAVYAARRGEPYDLALHDQAAQEASAGPDIQQLPPDPDARAQVISLMGASAMTASGLRQTASTHDPLAWRELPDGAWASPSGRRYGAGTRQVRLVMAKRQAMGVDTGPDQWEQARARMRAQVHAATGDGVVVQLHPGRAGSMARHPAGSARRG